MADYQFLRNFLKLGVIIILILLTFVGGALGRKWNLVKYQHHQQHRLKTGSSNMFISMYEHESYRGKVHQQTISRTCTNVPQEYNDWASSIVLHDHCVTLCDQPDCQGPCTNFFPNEKGMGRLSRFGLNDKVSSVKYCYRFR